MHPPFDFFGSPSGCSARVALRQLPDYFVYFIWEKGVDPGWVPNLRSLLNKFVGFIMHADCNSLFAAGI